jgi:hypothetical protein
MEVRSMSTLRDTASWVIVDRRTGRPFMETFNRSVVDRLNRDNFEAVPILQYLQNLNAEVRTHGRA